MLNQARGPRQIDARSSSYNPQMSPLLGSTLSVVGAGIMAEAIIAGVLERQLVAAGSIVASHPRADRRQALGLVKSTLDRVRTIRR